MRIIYTVSRKMQKKTSLRTADLSPRSSPLRDVLPPRETSLNSDERGETSAVRRLKKKINGMLGFC